MKTFLIIVITAVLTLTVVSLTYGVRTRIERLWMISAIKVPGRMALTEIQADMNAGHYDVAKVKIDVLVSVWQRFDSGPDSFSGPGIGNIMVEFSKHETNSNSTFQKP